MSALEALEIATRNRSNYLAAKEAFNRKDLDACVAFYAVDHQIMSTPSPKGREHIRAFFAGTHQTWQDIRIVVEQVVAEKEWVAGRSVITAIHSNVVFGIQPTLRRIETTFWDFHRFNGDGLIVETWNLMDSLAIMRQLGFPPGPR